MFPGRGPKEAFPRIVLQDVLRVKTQTPGLVSKSWNRHQPLGIPIHFR